VLNSLSEITRNTPSLLKHLTENILLCYFLMISSSPNISPVDTLEIYNFFYFFFKVIYKFRLNFEKKIKIPKNLFV